MSALTNESTVNDDHSSSRDDQQSQQHTQAQQQRYPSTNSSSRHSTPNSSGGEKQFHFSNSYNTDRGSGQNSRTSSVAELGTVNNEGFSNYTEIIHHLQSVWNSHNKPADGARRTAHNSGSVSSNDPNNNESISSNYSKDHSQPTS
ncbi:unnamed protein product, partial [Adineta ricciae]